MSGYFQVSTRVAEFFSICRTHLAVSSCGGPTVWLSGNFGGRSYAETLAAATVVRDQYMRPWKLASPIVASGRGSALSRVLLASNGTVQNAYENSTATDPRAPCPAGAVCCFDAKGAPRTRRLLRNATQYRVLSVVGEDVVASVVVTVNNHTLPAVSLLRSLSPSQLSDGGRPVKLVCDPVSTACFFVPAGFFGNGTQSLGISDAAYAAVPRLCETPLGANVMVDSSSSGASIWDQFAPMRASNFPGAARAGCVAVAHNSSVALYACTELRTAFAIPLIGVAATPLFGKAAILSAVLEMNAQQTNVAFIRVALSANTAVGIVQDFAVVVLGCHLSSPVQLPVSQSISLTANESAVVSFSVVGDASLAARGSCNVSLSSFGISLQSASVQFVANYTRLVWLRVAGPCTVDQLAVTCAPVDCFSKYLGAKNFYNPAIGLCQPAISCSASELYNPASNTCDSLINNTVAVQVVGSQVPDVTPVQTSIDCEHGTTTTAPSGELGCTCEPGWQTDYQQKYDTFVYCGVSTAFNESSAGSSNGAFAGTSSISWFMQILIIVCVLIGSILACCVIACICKARKRRRLRMAQHQYSVSNMIELRHAWTEGARRPHTESCEPATSENAFNFVLRGGVEKETNRHLSQAQLKELAQASAHAYFRIDASSYVPGTVMLSAPFIVFLIDRSHPLFASMPVTPLTAEQAQRYICGTNENA